jgi:hypothetical protein
MRAALWMPPLQPFPSSPRHTEKLRFSFHDALPEESLGGNDNDNDEDLVADVDLPPEYRREFPQPAGTVLRTECSRLQQVYDQQLVEGMGNIHYPFANKMDWQLGAWMHDSGLAMTEMNQFLKLTYVSFLRYYHCYLHIVYSDTGKTSFIQKCECLTLTTRIPA